MSERSYFVVRIGTRKGAGAYVTSCDGDDWTTSTRQRDAYQWEASRSGKAFAELATIAIGDARVVRLVPRRASPTGSKGT